MTYKITKTKKWASIFLGSLLVFVSLFSFVLFPGNAHAQMLVHDAPAFALQTQREVRTSFSNALLAAGLGALVQGASYFARKLAYDTARYVASGGKGQSALVFQDGVYEYLGKTGNEAAGAFIEELGEPFGLNFCKPPNIQTAVFIQIGLRSIYDLSATGPGGPRKPNCTGTQFYKNWRYADYEQYGKDVISQNFSKSLIVSQSDFGFAMGAQAKIDNEVLQKKEAASKERLEGQGFKPLSGAISGRIKTPADVVREETTAVTKKHQGELSAGQIAGIYGSGAEQILPMAGQVFLNTLLAEFLNNILTDGLFPEGGDELADGGGGLVTGQFASPLTINRKRAEAAFRELLTIVPTKDLGDFDTVAQLASCPDENPGMYNCVIDSGLQRLLQIALQTPNEVMTVREAVDSSEGLLDGNRPFISPRREVDNQNVSSENGCHKTGYCYSNIQKLRKLRIVPLGWELAALKADPDNPHEWTLKKVMDGFEDCNAQGRADANHPYCHLVDPNWIVKAPPARCEARGYTNTLALDGTAQRRKECLDISTCVQFDKDGRCVTDGYQYCTKEKNVWRLPSAQCPEHYATCKTYIAEDGAVNSYLSRTLNFEQCTQESVGCRAYALEQTDGSWQNSADINFDLKEHGRAGTAYFNRTIADKGCPSGEDGCSAFYQALGQQQRGDLLFLKKAPDYLGCYDIDLQTPEIDWPQTEAELTLLRDRPEQCERYASVCTPEEIACERYTPVAASGLPVTGIIGSNLCDSRCVGSDAFRQEATDFEQSRFPLYFIPNDADRCEVQHVGCDEFTNLDVGNGSEIEHYSSLDRCEVPEEGNSRIYFTWEGSAQEGFVLKRHRLLLISDAQRQYIESIEGFGFLLKNEMARREGDVANGEPIPSPAYADDSMQSLLVNFLLCNEEKYNIRVDNPNSLDGAPPDCRAFTDEDGNVFYRLHSEVVEVSEQCQRLRKTEPNLFVDDNINDPGRCVAVGGRFENNECQRCSGGGVFENGACMYKALTDSSNSCPSAAAGCRSYIGNTGNNLEQIYFTGFEPADESDDALNDAKEGWSADERVRPEATVVGEHSLLVSGGQATYSFDEDVIRPQNWYHLTFWAKGDTVSVSTRLEGAGRQFAFSNNRVSIGRSWREYQVGPVFFDGEIDRGIRLVFEGQADRLYFIDNVKVQLLTDHEFLIKNSWQTEDGYDAPLVCDAFPNDGIPGEALGCRVYTNSLGGELTTTGFDKLCREEAVGCTSMYDTYNTLDTEGAMVYNLWCDASNVLDPETCVITDLDDPARAEFAVCEVPVGHDGCYIESLELPDDERSPQEVIDQRLSNAVMTQSTVIVPADTPLSDPIHLTYNNQTKCPSDFIGCRVVGLESQEVQSTDDEVYEFIDRALRVSDPAHYGETLCNERELGCGEFRSAGELSFFKDPNVTGSTLCEYIEPTVASGERAGWYQKDTGLCVGGARDGQVCTTDAHCGEGAQCNTEVRVPCYENYVIDDQTYGIWSQESGGYDGYVGICPSKQSGCTEFVDRADQINSPEGKAYYHIATNELLQSQVCDGQVSLKEGCILLDRTDNPNKLYDTNATYDESSNLGGNDVAQKHGFVEPVVDPDTNDANLLVSVIRDRQCSEWLYCKTASVEFDEELNKPVKVCTEFGNCREMTDDGVCLDPVDTSLNPDDPFISVLNEDKYVGRETGWFDEEYTGYSLLGRYSISDYVQVNFPDEKVLSLAYAIHPALDGERPDDPDGGNACTYKEVTPNGVVTKNEPNFYVRCGFDNGGVCYDARCIYPIGGRFPANVGGFRFELPADPGAREGLIVRSTERVKAILESEKGLCKIHPETDSPYPTSVAFDEDLLGQVLAVSERVHPEDELIKRWDFSDGKFQRYSHVNVCNDADGSACSCEYERVEYKDGTIDYWTTSGDHNIPQGVCSNSGAPFDGKPCTINEECGFEDSPGICSTRRRMSLHVGQLGHCLEFDLSRPLSNGRFSCLTWLPSDVSATRVDNFNNKASTGYYPNLDAKIAAGPNAGSEFGKLYCIDSNAHGLGSHDADMYVGYNGDGIVRDVPDTDAAVGEAHRWYGGGPAPSAPNGNIQESPYGWLISGHAHVMPEHIMQNIYSFVQEVMWNTSPNIVTTYVSSPKRYAEWLGSFWRNNNSPTINRWIGNSEMNDRHMDNHGWGVHPETPVGSLDGHEDLLSHDFFAFRGFRGENGSYYSDVEAPELIPHVFEPYEEEIEKIYYGPFVVLGGLEFGVDAREAYTPNSLYVTDRVILDLERLRTRQDVIVRPVVSNGDQYNVAFINEILDPFFGVRNIGAEHRLITFRAEPQVDGQGDVTYGMIVMTDDKTNEHAREPTVLSCIDYVIHRGLNFNKLEYEDKCGFVGHLARFFVDEDGRLIGSNSGNFGSHYWFDEDEVDDRIMYGDNGFENMSALWRFSFVEPALAVSFQLKASCTEYALVHDTYLDDSIQTLNKAWTDRVWKDSQSQVISMPREETYRPYGSLPYAADTFEDNERLKRHVFDHKPSRGIPLACRSSIVVSTGVLEPPLDTSPFCVGLLPSTYSQDDRRQHVLKPTDDESGEKALQQLFVKYKKKVRNSDGAQAFFGNFVESEEDVSGDLHEVTSHPKVFSLNTYNCFDQEAEGECTAAEQNSFTIVTNGEPKNASFSVPDYNGDGAPDEDINPRNGIPDPIIDRQSTTAVLRFFAYADDNRMPIRRVMVDWGDTSEILNQYRYGRYQNHKPYCDSTVGDRPLQRCGGTQITCNSQEDCAFLTGEARFCLVPNATHFGDNVRACIDKPFVYQHSYSCQDGDGNEGKRVTIRDMLAFNQGYVADLISQGLRRDFIQEAHDKLLRQPGVSDESEVCIFRPRVQILDNWGWCNGTCDGDGCYNDKAGFGRGRECNAVQSPFPWTHYNGAIFIVKD